eukprot:tig00000237_g20488.t1
MELLKAVEQSADEELKQQFMKTMTLVGRCIALFGFDGISFSFNGGKDSTVLLHVLRAAIAQHLAQAAPNGGAVSAEATNAALRRVRFVYFNSANMFQEIHEFLQQTSELYGVEIKFLDANYKAGLSELIRESKVKVILMGQRQGDPGAVNLEHFSPTDPGWPPIIRVNAILDWTYAQVWRFLVDFKLPYCSLYDRGYTSIGGQLDTLPNPALKNANGTFKPAAALEDWSQERAGRIAKKPAPSPTPPSSSNSLPSMSPSVSSSSLSVLSVSNAPGGAPRSHQAAGIIIIGDEILSGKVVDANGPFLCRELRELGIGVRQLAVIPDEQTAIASHVAAFARQYDLVFTTGGLGPTHDDRTVAALAEAFGVPVRRDPALAEAVAAFYGPACTEAHLRQADVPDGCRLLAVPSVPFPTLVMKNVFVLPGIPEYVRLKMGLLREELRGHPFALRKLFLDRGVSEGAVAHLLEETQAAFPGVKVGSYPFLERDFSVVVTLEGSLRDEEAVERAARHLAARLPPGALLRTSSDNLPL